MGKPIATYAAVPSARHIGHLHDLVHLDGKVLGEMIVTDVDSPQKHLPEWQIFNKAWCQIKLYTT